MKLDDVIQLLNARPKAPATKATAFKDAVFSVIAERATQLKPIVEHGYLRCSAIPKVLDALPRLRFAQHMSDILPSLQPNTLGEQLNFDVGHALHGWWQNVYVGQLTEKTGFRLWGDWACLGCKDRQSGVVRPGKCAKCDLDYHYSELEIINDVLRYKGHPDGLLVETPAFDPSIVMEIKTIGTQAFDQLEEPAADHRRQVTAYQHGTNCREAIYIYVDKGKQSLWKKVDYGFVTVGGPRVKVFHEQFNEALWAQMETGIKEFWTILDRVQAAA